MITFLTSIFQPPSSAQLSAIYSWNQLDIPFITAQGLNAKTEKELGFDGDSPIVSDMIIKSNKVVTTPLLGIINADIVVGLEFMNRLQSIVEKYGQDIFLSGSRLDVNFKGQIASRNELAEFMRLPPTTHREGSADIFISTVSMMHRMASEMPEFIMGRLAWDNWIHLWFQQQDLKCFNITRVLPTYHINHGYEHLKINTLGQIGNTPSGKHNLRLWGSPTRTVETSDWPEP